MAIQVFCENCKKELDEPGAILLGPPRKNDNGVDETEKYHLCVICYEVVKKEIQGK